MFLEKWGHLGLQSPNPIGQQSLQGYECACSHLPARLDHVTFLGPIAVSMMEVVLPLNYLGGLHVLPCVTFKQLLYTAGTFAY